MSKKCLHALLVGINNYHPASVNVNNLGGSLNDVLTIDEYLRKTFKNHKDFEPVKPKILMDDEASREGVIKAFRAKAAEAKEGDTFYFHYSGHGSREKAPPEFEAAFGEDKNETIVLYDSRTPDGMDLADKELAFLLSEIPKGVHTVLTMDCCHAGSNSRDAGDMGVNTNTRQSEDATQKRNLNTYIGPYADQHAAGQDLEVPDSNYLAIGACRHDEKALEIDGKGLFTKTLIASLEADINNRSYAGIYSRLNSIVKNTTKNQHPQFEYYGEINPLASFLEGKESTLPLFATVKFRQGEWRMNFGAINGLRHHEIKNQRIPIFDGMYQNKRVGYAKLKHLGLQDSILEMIGDPPSNVELELYAGVNGFPLNVYLDNIDEDPHIQKAIETGWLSRIMLVSNQEEAEYIVKAENGNFGIYSRDPESLLFGLDSQSSRSAAYIFQILNGIANWERMLTLDNPVSDLSKQAVQLQLFINGSETPYEEDYWIVEYDENAGNVPFTVRAKNNSSRHLYFNLLYLSPEKGIFLVNRDTAQKTTGPGETKELFKAAAGIAYENLNQIENHLVLIASTEQLENYHFFQEGIPRDEFGKINHHDPSKHGLLRNLFPTEPKSDWTTRIQTIKVIRPTAAISQSKAEMSNLEIEGHNNFNAKLSMLEVQTPTRSIGAQAPVHKAVADIPNASLLSLKGEGQPPTSLEISGFQDESALRNDPLKLKVKAPTTDNEVILPFTFDGEYFLPVGVPRSGLKSGESQEFDIHHLPEEQQKTRSLGKALKMYFLKATVDKQNNQLRRVIYQDDGEIERTEDGLQDAIDGAEKILVVIHGIIGDTEELAKSVKFAVDEGRYDLVLTYDYENLSTSIKVTGQKLKRRLVELGLDDKGIDIMAHSMGGLVSRWMIEKENGGRFVNRLIMLGTPNAGSPFAKLAPAIPALIALAANFKSPFLAPLVYLLHWLNDSDQINKTLAEMDADSDILNDLNAQDAPKTKYTIIGGNVSNYEGAEGSAITKMIERITIGIGNLANRKKDNDVAVEIGSIFHIPEDDRVKHIEIGTHHLVYFTHQTSVAQLKEVL